MGEANQALTDAEADLHARVFHPYAWRKRNSAQNNGTRFAHYTSAKVALDILRSREVWLRNSQVMNDFSEVHHGETCIRTAWEEEALGGQLQKVIRELDPSLPDRLRELYNGWATVRQLQSFLISLSEHGTSGGEFDEDRYGRLSMWRAYGGSTNVAFVLNNGPFLRPSDALKAYTHPVLYEDVAGFRRHFCEFVDSLSSNSEYLRKRGPEAVLNSIFYAFHSAALSTKHPGFAEEREWRVIYSPFLEESDKLYSTIETVNDLPQKVFKLPLRDFPEEGFFGAEPVSLIERIIIGPTAFPGPIYEAFAIELNQLGVADPASKLVVSDIPLRR